MLCLLKLLCIVLCCHVLMYSPGHCILINAVFLYSGCYCFSVLCQSLLTLLRNSLLFCEIHRFFANHFTPLFFLYFVIVTAILCSALTPFVQLPYPVVNSTVPTFLVATLLLNLLLLINIMFLFLQAARMPATAAQPSVPA